MSKSVIILGAGGHGKVVMDIVLCSGDTVLGFLDDAPPGETFMGLPVLGGCGEYPRWPEACFVIAVGSGAVRQRLARAMEGVRWYTAIHPRAVVSPLETSIGQGSVVMANAVINPGAKIGAHSIINTSAVVEHDSCVGDFVHVSVGAKLAGNVTVGHRAWIGIGAVVSNNLTVCADCTLGAGAVVVRDLREPGTYVGVPAEKL